MNTSRAIGLCSVLACGAIALAVASKIAPEVRAQRAGGAPAIPAEDLSSGRVQVVGRLGVPLGTVVEVVARVGEASTGREFVPPFRYDLIVERVGAATLAAPARFLFEVDGASVVRLVPGHAQLDGLIKDLSTPGARQQVSADGVMAAKSIPVAEAESYRKSYVGSVRRLLVYEVGAWGGAPANWPAEYGFVAPPVRFAFHTKLHVIAEK